MRWKQQNPSAVPKDAAALRHRPRALPWDFGTRDTGVTGLIPCFVTTTVLLHLLPSCVIYLLSPCQEWEHGEDRVARGCSRGARARHQAAQGCGRRIRWRRSPLPQEDANKYPHCHPDLHLPPPRTGEIPEISWEGWRTKKAAASIRVPKILEAPLPVEHQGNNTEWFVGLG